MSRITAWLRRFMAGRYGTDKLNMAILGAGLVCAIITMFVRNPFVALALTFISYGCMIWAIFRSFSRNVYKRYQENHRFLLFFDRLKDRKHRIFQCPRCRQMVRVPRGKGKIAITCPKCRERFIKKT
jgi:hypothetical protein